MPDTPSPEALEAARPIADKAINNRICCGKYPGCQTEAWRVALALDIALALDRFAAARVEAERERCTAIIERDSQAPRRSTYGELKARIRSGAAP